MKSKKNLNPETEKTITMACTKYLEKFREEIAGYPIYVASNPTDQMYLDKIREIAARYIDENDVYDNSCGSMLHPAWRELMWIPRVNSPEMDVFLDALCKPDSAETVQKVLKAAIKEEMLRSSWYRILKFGLEFPFSFYAVKEAKKFLTTKEFTWVMYNAPWCYSGPYREKDGITNEDVLELINACNMEEFLPANDWRQYYQPKESEMTVYIYDEDIEDESDLSSVFSWMSSPLQVVKHYLEISGEYACFGAYTAQIKREDVFWCFARDDGVERGIVLNPDKLYDIEHVEGVAELCDEDELQEIEEDYA